MKAPKHILAAINAASGPIGAKRLPIKNKRAQEWLTDKLGIVTDDNRHQIDGAMFPVNFYWPAQMWCVELT